jgi:hypothetical protein
MTITTTHTSWFWFGAAQASLEDPQRVGESPQHRYE